jgi:hypothetical protein
MTDPKKPSLADLIAGTPGAQSREQAQESIKTRRAQLLNTTEPPPDFAAAEPLPIVDAPEDFAKSFFQRLMAKGEPTPQPFAPRLVVDNDTAPDGDDEPDPPKAV